MSARFFSVTLSALGRLGRYLESFVSRVVFFLSTNSSSSVAMYVNASAPFLKCMSAVGRTPVIDSPYVPVYAVVPFDRTCTIAPFKKYVFIAWFMAASIVAREGVAVADA